MNYPANPYAPIGVGGVGSSQGQDVTRRSPYTYLYNVTLTGNQAVTNDSVSILTDSDFYMLGMYISAATSTFFSFRIGDPSGYYFSNGLVSAINISNFSGMPTPWVPTVFYPRGSRIVVDITDSSGSTNTIQLAFPGVRVF